MGFLECHLAEAFRQVPVPHTWPLPPIPSCPLIRLQLIEIGGESGTQPHSCPGASGPQIVVKLTMKIFCAGWEAVMQGTRRALGAIIGSSGPAQSSCPPRLEMR